MIYPVPIKYWFSNKNSPFHEDYELVKRKLPKLKCVNCGGKITLETGYVSHGFAYGYALTAWGLQNPYAIAPYLEGRIIATAEQWRNRHEQAEIIDFETGKPISTSISCISRL